MEVDEAVACMRDAAEVYRESGESYRLSMAQRWLAEMEAVLAPPSIRE